MQILLVSSFLYSALGATQMKLCYVYPIVHKPPVSRGRKLKSPELALRRGCKGSGWLRERVRRDSAGAVDSPPSKKQKHPVTLGQNGDGVHSLYPAGGAKVRGRGRQTHGRNLPDIFHSNSLSHRIKSPTGARMRNGGPDAVLLGGRLRNRLTPDAIRAAFMVIQCVGEIGYTGRF